MKLPSVLFAFVFLVSTLATGMGDTIEFTNGAKLNGTITRVDDAAKTVTINATLRGRNYVRTYPFANIRSITQNGKQRVLGNAPAPVSAGKTVRSEGEINQLIATVGASEPSWLASTRLNYPASMDLNWPMPAPEGWNNKKNIGQFIWDVINPNQGRWREGVKFMLFLIDRHRNGSHANNMAKKGVASMYFRLFQDYPRAAYWWRQASLQANDPGHILLAECYFRMGNEKMALAALAGKPANTQTVKLLGTMGRTDQAVRLADALARSRQPHELYLLAGDALALAGQYQKAISYYQKTLNDRRKPRNKQYEKRYHARARESIASIRLFELMNVSKLKDGTYVDSATGYEAPIRVEAKVSAGKITGLRILSHREKQYYSALRDTPAQILAKQSVKDIDATSRATITSQAIVNAAAKALAMGQP